MVAGEVAENLTSVLQNMPEGFFGNLGVLMTILKAAGIAFIIYVIYIVISFAVNFRRYRILKRIDRRLLVLEEKMDLVLKEKKKKRKK